MQIKKSAVECYKLTMQSEWANFILDHSKGKGTLSIFSSYGDWGYHWNATCDNFKEFLISLDFSYAAKKLGAHNFLNVKQTFETWRQQVLIDRRNKHLTEEEAREAYDDIKEIEIKADSLDIIKGLFHSGNYSSITILYEGTPYLAMDVDPAFQKLWDGPWQDFVSHLREEINNNYSE